LLPDLRDAGLDLRPVRVLHRQDDVTSDQPPRFAGRLISSLRKKDWGPAKRPGPLLSPKNQPPREAGRLTDPVQIRLRSVSLSNRWMDSGRKVKLIWVP